MHGAGLLAAITPANDLYCYHYDATGNTVAITDASETIVNSYDYSPFGMIISESETFVQPFKYVGRLGVMSEGDFYYMRARYYDPLNGRFISEDPLGFDGGDVNLYVYVQNNPVLLVDPTGLLTTAQNFAIGAAGTTASMVTMSSVVLAPYAPLVGGGTAAILTLSAGGTPSEALWNGLTAALGGPLFKFAVDGAVGAEGLVMAGVGDYLLDLIWADQPPPWEASDDNSCP